MAGEKAGEGGREAEKHTVREKKSWKEVMETRRGKVKTRADRGRRGNKGKNEEEEERRELTGMVKIGRESGDGDGLSRNTQDKQ